MSDQETSRRTASPQSKSGAKKDAAEKQYFLPFRKLGARKAIIFVHGFAHVVETWAPFAKLLMEDRSLDDWDLFSLGYRSQARFELLTDDSSLSNQAEILYSNLALPPVAEYESIAFVAHSVGGLLVQRVLIDFDDVLAKTTHLFLFGTPSTGSQSARRWRFLNAQLRDMARGSAFIEDLRTSWSQKFSSPYRFHFEIVAGVDDEIVRAASVRKPFPEVKLAIVEGDHDTMIRPASAQAKVFQIVKAGLQVQPPQAPPPKPPAPRLPVRSFISYCRQDSDWLMSIEAALFPLLRRDTIDAIWDDRKIKPGEPWHDAIDTALQAADVAILLVTPAFLASSFIRQHELPFLLRRASEAAPNNLCLIWLEIETIDLERPEFQDIRAEATQFMEQLKKRQELNRRKTLKGIPPERLVLELTGIARLIRDILNR